MKGIFLRRRLQQGRNKAIIQTVNSYQVPAVSSTRSIKYPQYQVPAVSVTSRQLFVHCSLLTVHCLLLSSFMAESAQSKSNPNHTHANKRSRVGWFRNFLSKGDLNRAAYSHSTSNGAGWIY
ncbi:hypothetical protein NIES4073_50610 [Kalymmatonema gypsitolerans NIES-4073]|nr:hypothetical protein NIES4073_50610 [Scytonema sp. NIES-4073]